MYEYKPQTWASAIRQATFEVMPIIWAGKSTGSQVMERAREILIGWKHA